MNEEILRATHDGKLKIGDKLIPCAVLENGTRVISQSGVYESLGRYKKPRKNPRAVDDLPSFMAANNLKPFITEDLARSTAPIRFRWPKGGGEGGNIAYGYDAKLLPQICDLYLQADEAGVITNPQTHIVRACKILLRSFAVVGIIALVDEATGYQEVRDRQALQDILDKYLLKEYQRRWAKRFPDEFYKEMFRLRRWQWRGMKPNRPSIVGKYTEDIVYMRIAPGIHDELQRLNPPNDKGRRKSKHHQWLTEDIGHPALAQHLDRVIIIMRLSSSWDQFMRHLARLFPRLVGQTELAFRGDSGDDE